MSSPALFCCFPSWLAAATVTLVLVRWSTIGAVGVAFLKVHTLAPFSNASLLVLLVLMLLRMWTEALIKVLKILAALKVTIITIRIVVTFLAIAKTLLAAGVPILFCIIIFLALLAISKSILLLLFLPFSLPGSLCSLCLGFC